MSHPLGGAHKQVESVQKAQINATKRRWGWLVRTTKCQGAEHLAQRVLKVIQSMSGDIEPS
jgi:hypothetical protein